MSGYADHGPSSAQLKFLGFLGRLHGSVDRASGYVTPDPSQGFPLISVREVSGRINRSGLPRHSV